MTKDDEMKPEIPLKSGDMVDALTTWKRVHTWRAGVRRKTKRIYNKAVRRAVKQQLENDNEQAIEKDHRINGGQTDGAPGNRGVYL